jgi:hypothetical protein
MTNEEIKFIQDHIINFESTKLGFARNIGHDVLAEYERLYRKYLDANFVLTYWCGSCVLDMLQRLMFYYENFLSSQATLTIETAEEPILVQESVQPAPKKTRKKK